MRRIQQLSDDLINQIAAGEVIERPASIVKELVENSLDAGAGTITIEVAGGGIDLISVRDDGSGIGPEDLPLALTRHCTSKIARPQDLAAIATLGFRGEALASIAAVAAVAVTSRVDSAPHGWRIGAAAAGAGSAARPAPHSVGTTVEVRDLFAHIPARRRFLKRAQTELLHIQQLVRRLAFCVPGVAFALVQDGRPGLTLPAAGDERAAARRWRAIFGGEFAAHAGFVDVTAGGVRVHGWIGSPALARNQADLQTLAVNGRIIRDRQLAHGIRLAYARALPPGKFASYALHIELAPAAVDVNVHPGKAEVRFHALREVHDLVFAATGRALGEPVAQLARDPYRAAGPAVLQVADAARSGVPARASSAGATETRRAESPVPVLAAVGERFLLRQEGPAIVAYDVRGLAAAVAGRRLKAARLQAPVAARPLLFPARLPPAPEPLPPQSIAALAEYGCELTQLGPASYALRSLPTLLPEVEPESFAAALHGEFKRLPRDPVAGLAAAVAAALKIPASSAERGPWLEALCKRAGELGLDLGPFSVRLDAAALAERLSAP